MSDMTNKSKDTETEQLRKLVNRLKEEHARQLATCARLRGQRNLAYTYLVAARAEVRTLKAGGLRPL